MILKTEQLRSTMRPPVTVKGTKEGLLFLLDEEVAFDTLITYLQELLVDEESSLFEGPNIPVSVDYGSRQLTASDCQQLLNVFLTSHSFVIKEWSSHTTARQSMFSNRSKGTTQTIHFHTIRSGQECTFDGDVVVIGDVNPGGVVQATGDIYVFGRLAGIAHAGINGNHECIVAAGEFVPMQIRIGTVVSHIPRFEKPENRMAMEFAYLRDEGMSIEGIQGLSQFRRQRTT